jgi:hypothetical protein
MALVLQDRVSVNSTGSGTGNLALGSAYPGYRTFASCIPDGSLVYYTISNQAVGYDTQWEVGYGTYDLDTNTLQRNTGSSATSGIYSSSNSNAYVDFTAGTNGLQVFITYPSEQAVFQQTTGLTEFNEGPISVVGTNATAGTFSSTLAQFTSNEPDYSQMYIQNQNASANSSTDIAAYNNLGDGTYFFVDMGIASSAYNAAAYPIFQANDAYLYSYGNASTVSRLMIGTESPSANVVIFAGGVNTNNTSLTISGANQNATFANSVTVTANLAANNATFTNFAYSLNSNTAAAANTSVLVTQAYVDAAVATGFTVHTPVNLATTAALTGTPTYNNGTDGVGATLTAAGVGTLSVDGQNAAANFRILVQSQANSAHNGAYLVTTEGTGGAAYVLTRTTDFNQAAAGEIANNAYFFVDGGDTLIGHSFVLSQLTSPIVVGTTALPFVEFAAQLTYTGTAPINVSGQVISLTGIVPVANGGTNLSTYTAGDILYANATNTIGKLSVGSQYQVLTMGASAPTWGAVNLANANAITGSLGATYGGTGQTTYTLGDIIYSNGTNTLAKLAGQTTTSQKVLTQTGTGTVSAAPSWDNTLTGFTLANATVQNTSTVTLKDTLFTLQDDADATKQGQFNLSGATAGATTVYTLPAGSANVSTLVDIQSAQTLTGTKTFNNIQANGTVNFVGATASNMAFGSSQVSGTLAIGGTSQTGTMTLGQSTVSQTTNIQAGATASGSTKTINIGTGGVSGSTTAIAIGSANGTTITLNGTVNGTISNATSATTATTATNIAGGAAGSIPYQTGAGATALLATGTGVLVGGATPSYSSAPTLTGTNFSGIPNSATTASSANGASTIVSRDATGNFSANTITANLTGTASTATNQSGGTVSATTGAFSGAVTLTGAAGQILLNNGTSNWIQYTSAGVGAPTFTTRSAGTKLVLYPAVAGAAADYAIGIEAATLWSSVDTTSAQFKWYGGTTLAATLTGAGALTLVSSCTATSFIASSDERLKTNWAGLDLDFVSKLAGIKSGTFERLSDGSRDVGVTAQSLQKLLPEAVVEGADGMLAVNYGGAALVAAVELAKVVEELRAEVKELKAKLANGA